MKICSRISGGSRISQTEECGANLRGAIANLLLGKIFAEKCMKMKEIGSGEGCPGSAPDPPMRIHLDVPIDAGLKFL